MDKLLKQMNWKNYRGKWQVEEIVWDVSLIAVGVLLVIYFYSKG